MRDPVLVGIASIPERVASLEQTVASLAPQADRICVSLNDYTFWPEFLDQYPNVHGTVRAVNGGDAEKFADIDDWDGVVATCDDDLLYPPDYIATLLEGLDRHGRDRIVGFHGGKTLGWNGRSLAATHKQIRCLGDLAEDDSDVNVLGTGALAFDTRHVPVWREVFRHANMADVHLACHAHRFGIPMVALAHRAGWLKDICPAEGRRIYESNHRQDGSRCDTTSARRAEMERIDWTAAPAVPRVQISIATCQRPQLLDALLSDLEPRTRWLDLQVAVYEDPTKADYSAARARATANGWDWHTFPERLGKARHHELVDQELAACKASDRDWFVFLPDDIRLLRHAIVRAIETWERLDDPATLTLWRLKDQEGQPNWTGLLPEERDDAFEVFHVDGIYLCRRDTLQALDYRCPPVNLTRSRGRSSGVGRAMSIALHRQGKRMYRVKRSLAIPVPGQPSVMNPDVTDRRYAGVCL